MEETGTWGAQLPLWPGLLLCISDLSLQHHAVPTQPEAWERLRSLASPETLVLTNNRNGDFSLAWAGRYLLEDYPTKAVVKVAVTGMQRQDVGLYQCVVYPSPDNAVVLYHQIRWAQCQENIMPITQTLRLTINKWDLLKLRNFCKAKNTWRGYLKCSTLIMRLMTTLYAILEPSTSS
ncbi:Trem3 [Phodopus roborovskii]|uniref:Trem3 protein n=1 Tax=Phodopus roborovskii TaxID=109678 RepID=A0AAV0A3Q4_PHORO|nr:Trem3 [Phodopus roborovskii]